MDKMMVETSLIRTHCFVSGPADGAPVLLVHGNITTGPVLAGRGRRVPRRPPPGRPRPARLRPDERKPIDATRGLRDWSDDLHALVEALGWAGSGRLHIAGWSNGGGVVQQYAIDHADELASITLVAPLSPYGFVELARTAHRAGTTGRGRAGHGRPRLRAPHGRRRHLEDDRCPAPGW